MKKYVKKNIIAIVVTFIMSFIFMYIAGKARSYSALGGEDLFPFIILTFWIMDYNTKKNSQK